MNYLIKNKWVDIWTRSIIINLPFYSINYDEFVIMRFLLESFDGSIKITFDFSILDLTPVSNPYMYVAVSLSIILLIFYILALRTDEKLINYRVKKSTKISKILCCCCNFGKYIYYHFRSPNMFEILSKISY
jgi:hypothetical protein